MPDMQEDRRKHVRDDQLIVLRKDQLDALLDESAQRTIERFYTEVGKRAIRNTVLFIGMCVVAVATWISKKGLISG